jgi:curved DNA-binding protein CbpA
MSPTVRASYELLGAAPGATEQELKKAYHRLALLYHPDRQADDSCADAASREFQKITDAYKLLLDPTRIFELNRKHVREKLFRPVIEGLNITFGSFFGYRVFDPTKAGSLKSLRLSGKTTAASPATDTGFDEWLPLEENSSVLDNPAYDAIEAVYAGRLSSEDEARLKGEVQARKLVELPWVMLNNQGILRFFESDLKGAKKCYLELCVRIPNNILFTYRLALCLILEAFKAPRRTLFGARKPDRIKIEKGIELLRRCLKLGACR